MHISKLKAFIRNKAEHLGLIVFIALLLTSIVAPTLSFANGPPDGPDRCKGYPTSFDFCTYRPASSDYFNPTIVVKTRWNWGLIKGSDQKTFRGIGECKWLRWAGFIPMRFCVRIAGPADPANCPQGGCVNNEVTSDSASNRGNRATNRLKLCAYEDPCFLDAGDMGAVGLCIPYVKSDFQPYHRWSKIRASSEEKSEFNNNDSAENISNAIITSLAVIGSPVAIAVLGFKLLALLPGLKNYHNWIVIGENRNKCVEIPAGPSPPPYCPELKDTPSLATVQEVCGLGQISTIGKPCVTTNITKNSYNATSNSFENNLIRVGFENIIAKCDDQNTTNCVTLTPDPNKDLHNDSKDLVSLCSEVGATKPCITFIGDGSGESRLRTKPPYRVVYRPVSSDPTISFGSDSTIWVSDPSAPNMQMEFYGINDANYYDLGVSIGNTGDVTGKSATDIKINFNPPAITMSDFSAGVSSFQAYVDLETPMQVCIKQLLSASNMPKPTDTDQVIPSSSNPSTNNVMEIGCIDRQPMPMPVVASCNSDTCSNPGNCPPKMGCNTTVDKPKMVIGLGNPMQYGYIGTVDATLSGNTPEHLYLHGIDFTTILTDNVFKLADQYGGNIKGNYDVDGDLNTYTGGIEYNNYKYVKGATKLCAKGFETDQLMLSKPLSFVFPSSDPADPSQPTPTPPTGISDQLDKRLIPNYVFGVMTTSGVYNPGTPICYDGRVAPNCPVADDGTSLGCCNSCYTPCMTNQLDLGKTVNQTTEGIRLKNAMEFGLCVDVPQPDPCPQDNSGSYGYATWPSTALGGTATGTCIGNYRNGPNGPPQRKCYGPANAGSLAQWSSNIINPCVSTPQAPQCSPYTFTDSIRIGGRGPAQPFSIYTCPSTNYGGFCTFQGYVNALGQYCRYYICGAQCINGSWANISCSGSTASNNSYCW